MSLVAPSERLVALPKDEKPADSAAEDVIVVDELRMRYGGKEAVAGITFRIARGEIFALLGPNGAGKTTTVEILEGFRERTDGAVSVLGVDPSEEEHLWSRADANARGGRQMSEPSEPRDYLRAAATSRVRLLPNRNGKEGVDGSSPSSDDWEVMRWEAVALDLAARSGITAPDWEIYKIDGKGVLIVTRFDRIGDHRIGYVSALTMLEAVDGDERSLGGVAKAPTFGAFPQSPL
jgi:energy-coupling factor transporter ATP-binding protein EcfA2